MREYHSIGGPNTGHKGKPCYVFEKYDGSNLRCEWRKKSGWSKYGSKKRTFDHTDSQFGDSIPLWQNIVGDIEERLTPLIRKKNYRMITLFAEYLGESSFAGTHKEDEPKRLVLFDVALNGIIMPPALFVKTFRYADYIAEFYGIYSYGNELIRKVREGEITNGEGVVCKGLDTKGRIWMSKIKTLTYLEKLKQVFQSGWEEYGE